MNEMKGKSEPGKVKVEQKALILQEERPTREIQCLPRGEKEPSFHHRNVSEPSYWAGGWACHFHPVSHPTG